MFLCPHWATAPHGCGLSNHLYKCKFCEKEKAGPMTGLTWSETHPEDAKKVDDDEVPGGVVVEKVSHLTLKWTYLLFDVVRKPDYTEPRRFNSHDWVGALVLVAGVVKDGRATPVLCKVVEDVRIRINPTLRTGQLMQCAILTGVSL